MKKLYAAAVLCFGLATSQAVAQQDENFTQYTSNMLYYNPAYAGVEGLTKLTAVHRTQWLGNSFAPKTQMVSFTTPIYRLSSGGGLHFAQDKIGAQSNLQAQGSYAYHLHIKELETKVSFGVRVGAIAKSIDTEVYEPNNIDDPLLNIGRQYEVQPDLGAGIYARSEKIFGGVAFSHLLQGEFKYAEDQTTAPLEPHMNVMFGYDYVYGRKITITPSLLVQSDFNTYNFTLSTIGNYDEKYWGGLAFRQGDAINIITGYSVLKDKSLRFGYAFDFTFRGQDAKSYGSHEVSLSYTLPPAKPNKDKILRNPRFRHD